MKIVYAILTLVAAFLIYVAFQPSAYEVSRTISIDAPPSKVFPYVNNRTLANSWNPWLKMDPGIQIAVSGPETGVGSKTSWAGGKDTGVGSATVTESIPNERVTVKLEYEKPFAMTQEAAYVLKSAGKQTEVTWLVQGNKNFVSKVMCTFMNMDKMVGGTFEKGLAELKALVETPVKK
jgi:hypothetical protein